MAKDVFLSVLSLHGPAHNSKVFRTVDRWWILQLDLVPMCQSVMAHTNQI